MSSMTGKNSAECGERHPDLPKHVDIYYFLKLEWLPSREEWREIYCVGKAGKKASI